MNIDGLTVTTYSRDLMNVARNNEDLFAYDRFPNNKGVYRVYVYKPTWRVFTVSSAEYKHNTIAIRDAILRTGLTEIDRIK